MGKSGIDMEQVRSVCEGVAEAAGFEALLIEWTSDRGRRILRIFLDKEDAPVTVEDCAMVSRRLSHVLDAENTIDCAYSLEVSTPGLDRPLVRLKDFERFRGHRAKVTLKDPLASGRKRLDGSIEQVQEDTITMKVEGEEYRFTLAQILRANLVYQGEL